VSCVSPVIAATSEMLANVPVDCSNWVVVPEAVRPGVHYSASVGASAVCTLWELRPGWKVEACRFPSSHR
jgi:hypothetical protein